MSDCFTLLQLGSGKLPRIGVRKTSLAPWTFDRVCQVAYFCEKDVKYRFHWEFSRVMTIRQHLNVLDVSRRSTPYLIHIPVIPEQLW